MPNMGELSDTFIGLEDAVQRACPHLRIETREGRGRCVVASEPIARGTVVLTCATAAALPELRAADICSERCSMCFGRPEGRRLLRCPRCALAAYCTADCQRADWADHRAECPFLRTLGRHVPAEACVALLLGRVVRGTHLGTHPRADGEGAVIATPLMHSRADVRALRGTGGTPSALALQVLALARQHLLPPSVTDDEALAYLAAFEANNFSPTDAHLEPVGFGVYPAAALLNHACRPTCTISYVFAGGDAAIIPPHLRSSLLVRTLLDLQPGDELTHSYCDPTLPLGERRTLLREGYGFECDCNACVEESCEAAALERTLTDRSAPWFTRGRALVRESGTIASEPNLPTSVAALASMAHDGAQPPAAMSDRQDVHTMLALEAAVIAHGIRLLREHLPPFHAEVLSAVRKLQARAALGGDAAALEATSRHLLAAARHSATLRTFVAAPDSETGYAPVNHPLYSQLLRPLAELYTHSFLGAEGSLPARFLDTRVALAGALGTPVAASAEEALPADAGGPPPTPGALRARAVALDARCATCLALRLARTNGSTNNLRSGTP